MANEASPDCFFATAAYASKVAWIVPGSVLLADAKATKPSIIASSLYRKEVRYLTHIDHVIVIATAGKQCVTFFVNGSLILGEKTYYMHYRSIK